MLLCGYQQRCPFVVVDDPAGFNTFHLSRGAFRGRRRPSKYSPILGDTPDPPKISGHVYFERYSMKSPGVFICYSLFFGIDSW